MKRSLSFGPSRPTALVAAGTALIALTYGLVRLAYGLFLPEVQADLGLGTSAAGYVSAGASTSYCAAAVLGFVTAGRRPRLLVLGAGLSAGVGSAAMASAQHPAVFSIAAILGSAGAGLASPAMAQLVRGSSAPPVRERDQARVNAGTGPGLVAAGLLALALLPNWRLAWGLVAALAVGVTAAVLWLDGERAARGAGLGVPTRSWWVALGDLVAGALGMGAGSAAVWNFGRTVLVGAGASERTSVLAWVALGLGGTAVIGTARLLDGVGPVAAWGVGTSVAGGATAVLALAPSRSGWALLACVAFGWGFTAATGALIAATSRIDPEQAPAGTSLLFVVLVLGQALGAPLVGSLASTAGFAPAFVTAAVAMLAAALLPPLRTGWRSASPAAVCVSPS